MGLAQQLARRLDALAEGVFGRFFVFQSTGDSMIAFCNFFDLEMNPSASLTWAWRSLLMVLRRFSTMGNWLFNWPTLFLFVNGFGFCFQFVLEAFNLLFAAGKLRQDTLHGLFSRFQLAREMVLLP
jgi:hypothetical protein